MNSTIIKNNNARRRRRKKGSPPPPPERGSAVAAHTTCYEQKTKMMGLKVGISIPLVDNSMGMVYIWMLIRLL